MINAGIVGSEGYAIGELYHLLIQHPDVKLNSIYAPHKKGMLVREQFRDLSNLKEIEFSDYANFEALDVLFLCLESGKSVEFLSKNDIPNSVKLIDFSADFRINGKYNNQSFTYGLAEGFRREISYSNYTSVPGSFAIAVLTPLIPLIKKGCLNSELHINAIVGKTEAFARSFINKNQSYDMIFDNFQVHKPFDHPHEREILNVIELFNPTFENKINFIPMRGNFNRGFYSSIYFESNLSLRELNELYRDYFEKHSFVTVVDNYPDIRDIINTNDAHIHLSKHNNQILIVSAMDNLLKGAAGNAVHLMNLMCSLVENAGLQMKPSIF